MASDPSIYAQSGKSAVTPYNPLTQIGDVARTGNALIQGRAAQMQMQGRNALGAAYQSVPIDPHTGLPDSQKLLAALQATPGGGYAMADAIPALQKQQLTQFELNKAQQEQSVTRMNTVNGAISSLLAKGPNVTRADVFGIVGGLQKAGLPVDQFMQSASMTMPGQDGAPLHDWVLNQASRAWPAAVQAEQFTPKISYQNVGGQLVPVDMNPNTSGGAPTLGLGLTPAEQASQVKGPMGPNGQPTVQSQAAWAQQQGLGNLVQGGAPGQASPFANGGRLPSALPSALLNPNRPGAVPQTGGAGQPQAAPVPGSIGAGSPGYAPAATAAPAAQPSIAQPASVQPGLVPAASPAMSGAAASPYGTAMVVGMGPGQTAGATAAGDASAKQWAGLQSSVGGSSGRIYQLQTALGDLQSLGQTGTGPSANTLNNVRSYLSSLPMVGQSLGIDPSKVASYDEANKYLTAYASARAGRFGGTTDQQLATTLSSNASTHISNLAAQDVVKANIGLERADQSQLASFQQGLDPVTGQPTGQQFTPDQFADYSSKWNTSHDARAFVADHLTPQQFGTMLSGMSPGDQAKFGATLNSGIQSGFINPPSWMQSQQPAANAPAAAPATTAPAAPATGPDPAAAPAPTQQAAAALPMSLNGYGQPAAVGGY